MRTRPVITILGATGAQGGGLARAILADPSRSFAVRAVTAKPDGAAARALAAAGAEIATADLDAAASLEHVMHGTYGVFAVTDDSDYCSSEREIVRTGQVARAAQRANARHVIWSTMEDTCHRAAHGHSKGEAALLEATLLSDLPSTFLRTSFYWDNLLHPGMGLRRASDGQLNFILPTADRPLPGITAADIGPCALSIFQCCGQFIGRTVGIAGAQLRGAAMAEAFARAMDERVKHVPMSFTDYAQLDFPRAADLANLFQYQYEFNAEYCAARSVETTRELYPGLMGFEQWLDGNAASLRTLSAR